MKLALTPNLLLIRFLKRVPGLHRASIRTTTCNNRFDFRFTLSELKKSVRLPAIGRQQAFHKTIFGKRIFMKAIFFSRDMPASKSLYAGLLIAGTAASILLSPKWAVPLIAWVAPAC